MTLDDLAVKIFEEICKDRHRQDARQFLRGLVEQKDDAELAELLGASNEEPSKAESAGVADNG